MNKENISEDVQKHLGELQMIERNIQNFAMQRQMIQSQLLEVESAIDEMKNSKETYKIVGNIMISSKKEDLKKELLEKQTLLGKRVDSLETQEKGMKEKAESLQKDILKAIK